jgi:8-oxo-dGTP diphosphatase
VPDPGSVPPPPPDRGEPGRGPQPDRPFPKGGSWDERASFCLLCGADLELREAFGAVRKCCTRCEYVFFRQTAMASVAVVVHERRLLLVRRGIQPYRGHWGFPGGFQEYGEAADEAAIRETREETGLEVVVERVLDVRFTRDDPRKKVNVALFLARPVEDPRPMAERLRAGDDALDAAFFGFDEMPGEIAFENNQRVLAELRRRFPDGDVR